MKRAYKIYKYFISAILIVMIPACDDFLEKSPLNNLTDKTFFKTEADIKQFTDGLYGGFTPGTNNIFFDYCTDLVGHNLSKAGNRQYSQLIFGTQTSTSGTIGLYFDYAPIRNAYIILEKIDEVPLSTASKNLHLGTIQYLLAYRYFMMFRAYEAVPIVREVLEVENSDIPSSPKEEVFQEALSFINQAIENLPSLGPNARERGRLTKLVALTLKADMLLYTSFRYGEALPGAKYSDAANAALAAIKEADACSYGLADDYEKLFIAEYQAENDAQKEIIFEYVRLKDIATDMFCVYHFGPRKNDIGWADFTVSQEAIDMYECTDGKLINKSSLYDPLHPFKNRDPRFELTTLYPGRPCSFLDGDTWISNTLDPSEGNPDYMLSTYNPLDTPPTGYINIKYWDRLKKGSTGYASFIAYRYAELLLMYAEALNEASGPSKEVYDALTKLRNRASIKMPAITSQTHPTKAELRDLIRRERVVELYGEGKRYWDVRRWGVGEIVQNKSFYSMHISKFNPDGSFAGYQDKIYARTSLTDPTKEELFEIPDGAIGGRLLHTGIFNDAKYYVWPIPQTAINNSFSGALKQHPLWQ